MLTASYHRSERTLWQARKRLERDDLSDDERADEETLFGLSQEQLDRLDRSERHHE